MRSKQFSRREFLRLSSVAAAGAALAACAVPAAPATAPQAAPEAGPQAPAGPTNIRFSVWYGQGDIEVWDAVIDAFEKATPEVKVDFEPLAWSQYWQKLQVGLAAGDPPDVIGMGVGVSYD